MKIAFRVDASVQMGSGHLMRCLSLASSLREQAAEIVFICREHDGHLCDFVESKAYQVLRLPKLIEAAEVESKDDDPSHAIWLGCDWSLDAEQTASVMGERGEWGWLIVDHYALDFRWESRLRSQVKNIFVVDDLADRQHDCDALLDQNLSNEMESRYQGLVPETCRQFLGPSYALLRPEFYKERERLCREHGEVKRILVFFGSMDPQNYTGLVLEGIAKLDMADVKVDAVIGTSNPNQEILRKVCDAMTNVCLHVQVENMAELMAKADLAIGAGGATTWERCCLGLPSFALAIAENQVEVLKVAAEHGLLYSIDSANITAVTLGTHLSAILQNSMLRKHISMQSINMVDGKGLSRISAYLMKKPMTLRLAEDKDAGLLYAWRNHPAIRQVSRSSEAIDRGRHEEWFFRVMHDDQRHLLVGLLGPQEVGVIRFDLNGQNAEISLYLDPELKGQGLGGALLDAGECWLKDNYPNVKLLAADVLAGNIASEKLFERFGYKRDMMRFVKRFD